MNHIGEKIRELRKKNDMTQEKLADFLGMSYQAVSKWECGVACPDLSLIGPLTKLLHCTADELLGLDQTETNNRRSELENVLHQAWLDGGGERDGFRGVYDASAALVREFPGELKYLCNFAWAEANRAWSFDEDGIRKLEMEKAVVHFASVIENTDDESLKLSAINGISQYLGFLGRHEESRAYIELLPDTHAAKERLMENCLSGADLRKYRQTQLDDLLHRLLILLPQCCGNELIAIKDCEAILNRLIPDGNLMWLHCNLTELCQKKAKLLMHEKQYSEAIHALANGKFHAEHADYMENHPGVLHYSPKYFDLLTEDPVCTEDNCNPTYLEAFMMYLDSPCFDPIRSHSDFAELLT